MSDNISNLILQEVQEMKKEVNEIRGDVEILKETVVTKKDIVEFPAVKSVIYDIGDTISEINSSINRIETAQEKYEKRLDLLSIRSLDQEAEIKRIK